jgi:hypothetical protein
VNRYRVRVPYFYCIRCTAGTTGPDAEAEGQAHADEYGHEVRVVAKAEAIIRPVAEAVSRG